MVLYTIFEEGLALELKSGKKLLIGTQKPEALKVYITQL